MKLLINILLLAFPSAISIVKNEVISKETLVPKAVVNMVDKASELKNSEIQIVKNKPSNISHGCNSKP